MIKRLVPVCRAGAGRPSYDGHSVAKFSAMRTSEGSEQSVGNIVNVASTGENRCEVLAVITNSDVEAGKRIHTEGDVTLQLLPLPYSIEVS